MLNSLQLTNIKGFKSADIDLKRLTLLSGLNSSGKSTVLQSLALIRQSYEGGFLSNGSWLLNGDIVELGVGSDLLHEDNDTLQLGIGYRESGSTYAWCVDYAQDADVLSPLGITATGLANSVMFSENFQYLRADRVNPQTVYAKSGHAVGQKKSLGARGEYAAHFLAVFRDQAVLPELRQAEAPESTPGLLSQVNAWMQEFSPGVRMDVHEVAGTDLVRLSFTFGSGVNESNAYRPTNVGFGLAYSLPIVIACLATAPGGLVLLENPEAHLHPRGQMAMGRLTALAAAAGVQVIVETHSDHVLNGVRLAVKQGVVSADDVLLHFFARGGDHGQSTFVSPHITSEGKLTFWPEGFFDQWDRALLELID